MDNSTFVDSFESYVRRHSLFTHDDKILLTVSGGVDSMVMMSLFARTGYNFGVAHCNFCLRGQESDEDEVLVSEQAARCGVECFNRRFDTLGEMERTGESMEMAARRLRYDWFHSLCDEHGYTVIAIAHHMDDSIETFFINLFRSTGLRGLTGINHHYGRVVRPLMFATRREITEYAVANHIPYREDSSNSSKKYLRNKIRLGLVPMAREINPQFTRIMRGNLYRLNDAQRFVDAAIAKIRCEAVESVDGMDTIRVDRIDEAFPKEFVVYELLNSAYGFKGDVVDELCKSLALGQSGKRFYSRDYVACVDRGTIVVSAIQPEDSCMVEVESGATRSYCGNSVLYFERKNIDLVESLSVPSSEALIDESKLRYPLVLRRWQEGDWFVPFGMKGRKKLSDFLIDNKVPVIEKQRQFVLVSGEDIVWVVGRRIDDRYRIEPNSENILHVVAHTIQ